MSLPDLGTKRTSLEARQSMQNFEERKNSQLAERITSVQIEENKSVKSNKSYADLSDTETLYEVKETEAFAIKREDQTKSTLTNARPSVMDEGYEDILRSELDSDLSSLSSTSSHTQQVDFSLQSDFFDALGELPEVDDISADISVEEAAVDISQSVTVITQADTGKFVDPLTGEIVESSEEVAAPEPPPEEEGGEEEEEDEDFEFDLGLPPDVEEDEQLGDKAKVPEDETFEALIAMDTEPVVEIAEEIDFEALERENAARLLLENTQEFLHEIITNVVDTCEYIDPNIILRQNLDKTKLMMELATKLSDLDSEQKARFFLNRKTVEYFRRKKLFRCITDDNPATLQQDIEKFKLATANLDYKLGKEEETARVTEMKIFDLETQARNMEEKAQEQLQRFEDKVRKTLYRETFDKLKASVENQLQEFGVLRKEITKVRTILIQRQHTMATLMLNLKLVLLYLRQKLEKLENLGNQLKMRDFENLQTETTGLGTKIEERNVELNRLRLRCNADVHIMAHMKMKQQMISNTITIQESALIELIYEKQACREHLYDLKISRDRIRKQIKDMSFQGGLVDKPALMLDYDETMLRLEQMHAKVNLEKVKYADIQHRIHMTEGKCDDDEV